MKRKQNIIIDEDKDRPDFKICKVDETSSLFSKDILQFLSLKLVQV